MAMSGIEIDEECKCEFKHMKLPAKKGHAHERRKVAAFTINDEKTKVVIDRNIMDKTVGFLRDQDHDFESFEQLKAVLKEEYPNKARYILIDFNFKDKDSGQHHEKLAYIFWCPDTCQINEKMIYASTNGALKKQFGINIAIECHDFAELDYEEITKCLKKGK